jgi:oligoendopeptidase F
MERAQEATYGDGLDERFRHKYMWTWKPHYYRPGLSFYNFPYAFGLLFGIGLYAVYQERGESFVPEYKELLASTGEGTATDLAARFGIDIRKSESDLAARFGIDIRKSEFWENSLNVVAERIERYVKL